MAQRPLLGATPARGESILISIPGATTPVAMPLLDWILGDKLATLSASSRETQAPQPRGRPQLYDPRKPRSRPLRYSLLRFSCNCRSESAICATPKFRLWGARFRKMKMIWYDWNKAKKAGSLLFGKFMKLLRFNQPFASEKTFRSQNA